MQRDSRSTAIFSAAAIGILALSASVQLGFDRPHATSVPSTMEPDDIIGLAFQSSADREIGSDRRWVFPRLLAAQTQVGQTMTFALPGGRGIDLPLRDRFQVSRDSIGFVYSDPEAGASAEVVVHRGRVRGFIRFRDGLRLEQWRFATSDVTGEEVFEPEPPAVECTGSFPAPAMAEGGVAGAACNSPLRIDVLVAYTQSFAARFASIADFEAAALADVAQANAGLANSLVETRYFVAGFVEFSGSGTGNLNLDLERLTSSNDGIWESVHTARNELRADLVTLYSDSGGGGLAWLGVGNDAYGFSVVGSNGGFLLAHELGHNMGACHAPGDGGGCGTGGFFPFSSGHRFMAAGVEYRTIMAYAPGERIPHFSNPSVKFIETPTGVPGELGGISADNARTHAVTASTVANYRCAAGEYEDCDGDGVADDLAIAKGLAPDCNSTGIPDICDIAFGLSIDNDEDGVPDECSFPYDDDLQPDGFRALDIFGTEVSIGSRASSPRLVAAIGAPGFDDEVFYNSGAAYVYSSDSNGLFTAAPQLLEARDPNFPSTPQPAQNAYFGSGVQAFLRPRSSVPPYVYPERDFVIVGSYRWTESSSLGTFPSKGAIYLFGRPSPSTEGFAQPFNQLWRFTPPSTGGFQARENALFGYSVAMGRNRRESVDQIIVGAPGHSNGRGKVYLLRNYFVFDSATQSQKERGGLLSTRQLLTPVDGDYFGASVALDAHVPAGGTSRVIAVVGAPGRSEQRGGAYVYDRAPGGLPQNQSIGTFPNTGISLNPTGVYALSAGDRFGTAVAVRGRLVAVGAPGARDGRGVVHFWQRNSPAGSPSPFSYQYLGYFKAPDGEPNDGLGMSLSIAPTVTAGEVGYTVTIGAPNADVPTSTGIRNQAGKVYIVRKPLNQEGAELLQIRAASEPASGDAFGSSVSSIPGRAAIGIPFNDASGLNSGKARLIQTP